MPEIRTAEEYRASLKDDRQIFFEGERVGDVTDHAVLGHYVSLVAEGYAAVIERHGSSVGAPPTSAKELQALNEEMWSLGFLAALTYTSTMTLDTAARRIAASDPSSPFPARIDALVDDFRRRNVRIGQCITDAKGDRKLSPAAQPDPDAYLRVIERREDGVVIRGAKLHVTGAAFTHELLVIPTKAMKPGEEEYAIACCVPVDSPGVRLVTTAMGTLTGDVRMSPFGAEHRLPESLVIFDDVFVPHHRVMLEGESAMAAVFAHSLGLWERLAGLTQMTSDAEILVGLALAIAKANGTQSISHVKEKIAEMILYATLLRGALEAAIENSTVTVDGVPAPDELFTNAGKYYGAVNWTLMVRNLLDIAGGSVATAPSLADLENPEIGPDLLRYMRGADQDGEYRARLFHAIRDLTVSSYGGAKTVEKLQGGGGLQAQRIVMRLHFDEDRAVAAALRAAGIAAER